MIEILNTPENLWDLLLIVGLLLIAWSGLRNE